MRFEGVERNLVPAVTPPEELDIILKAQEQERKWWEAVPQLRTMEDLSHAVESGWAVPVPLEGMGYKLSAKILPEFRFLDQQTLELLQEIATQWHSQIKDEDKENCFLVISSLARTESFQQELIQKGFPAADVSTHTKLGAFDIAVVWFKQNRPDLLETLFDVIHEYTEQNSINAINEPTIGAMHIARNPHTSLH